MMKLSEERERKLYCAIAEKVMDLRVAIRMDDTPPDKDELDLKLFNLESDIWKGVKAALNLSD